MRSLLSNTCYRCRSSCAWKHRYSAGGSGCSVISSGTCQLANVIPDGRKPQLKRDASLGRQKPLSDAAAAAIAQVPLYAWWITTGRMRLCGRSPFRSLRSSSRLLGGSIASIAQVFHRGLQLARVLSSAIAPAPGASSIKGRQPEHGDGTNLEYHRRAVTDLPPDGMRISESRNFVIDHLHPPSDGWRLHHVGVL